VHKYNPTNRELEQKPDYVTKVHQDIENKEFIDKVTTVGKWIGGIAAAGLVGGLLMASTMPKKNNGRRDN